MWTLRPFDQYGVSCRGPKLCRGIMACRGNMARRGTMARNVTMARWFVPRGAAIATIRYEGHSKPYE